MCGIAGILRVHAPGAAPPPPEASIPEAWLDILDESIKHRGPDGHGRFRDRAVRADGSVVDVAFVHRRLAIIDPHDGHQPMVSERGRNEGEGLVAVVFNGCIYNHRELRKELERAGHQFETDHSDAEVLVHGWREWGHELPKWLDGMFSFALWDHSRGELFLARDRAGEKPLYVADIHPDDRRLPVGSYEQRPRLTVTFASSPAGFPKLGLSELDPVRAQWRGHMLAREIRNGYPESLLSMCIQGYQLNPGEAHRVVPGAADAAGLRIQPIGGEGRIGRTSYWQPPASRCGELEPKLLDYLLRKAVQSRLEADVPLGCFLSGGIDSSLVAAYAREKNPELRTYTVSMPDPRFDEAGWGELVGTKLGTKHETLQCEAHPAEDLVLLTRQLGLAFGDSSLLPAYWVCRAASKHVKVALTGDGGDELFCGYERYVGARVLARWHRLLRLLPDRALPQGDPRSVCSRLARLSVAARHGPTELSAIFATPDLSKLFGVAHWMQTLPAQTRRVGRTSKPKFPLDFASYDFETYLPDDLLRKMDTASMAVPIEVRSPFLEPELMEWTLGARLCSLMPRGQRKGLLRQVARKYLPAEIVDRPKQGFAIPIGEWFRTDYGGMKQLLMDHMNSTEPWGPPSLGIDLNMKFVRQMLAEHMTERRDHSQRLYMLLVLSIWAKWLGGL
jgi:asparagine synthase (glutamine-hydrolysing)